MYKISVVTICYNVEREIERTIKSVLEQDYPNMEYIIVDGGSSDGTMSVVNKYVDKVDCVISEPDNGIYDAMNKGIKAATGDWINFMNVGDAFFSKTVLSDFAKSVDEDTDVAYCDAMMIFHQGKKIYRPDPIAVLEKRMAFCHQSAFIRTLIHKERPFDLRYKLSADYDFFRYCYKSSKKFQYIPMIAADYESEEGLSVKRRYSGKKEDALINGDAFLLTGKIRLFLWLVKYRVKNVVKKFLPGSLINIIKGVK